jgi:hypothetical protein
VAARGHDNPRPRERELPAAPPGRLEDGQTGLYL